MICGGSPSPFVAIPHGLHRSSPVIYGNPRVNYGEWKDAIMGTNNQAAQSLLKKDYKTRDGLNEANF